MEKLGLTAGPRSSGTPCNADGFPMNDAVSQLEDRRFRGISEPARLSFLLSNGFSLSGKSRQRISPPP